MTVGKCFLNRTVGVLFSVDHCNGEDFAVVKAIHLNTQTMPAFLECSNHHKLAGSKLLEYDGFLGFQVLRFSGFQVLRFLGSQVLRFLDFQVFRFLGFQVFRFLGFQVFTFLCKYYLLAPFSMGNKHFSGLVVPYCDLPTEH